MSRSDEFWDAHDVARNHVHTDPDWSPEWEHRTPGKLTAMGHRMAHEDAAREGGSGIGAKYWTPYRFRQMKKQPYEKKTP